MQKLYSYGLMVLIGLVVSCLTLTTGLAQDKSGQTLVDQSAAQLAAELANPNATRGQIFTILDYVRYNGDVTGAAQNAFVFSLQPSLPIPVAEGTNVFIRPLIPVYLSQPVINESGFENKTSLGNISADVAIGKTWPSKWMTLVGVFAGFPTATNKELRSNFTTLGPEIVIGKVTSFGFLGIMVNHSWSLNTSDPDADSFTLLPETFWTTTEGRSRSSITAGQYFYTVNLEDGWQIQAQPTYAFNHAATSGNKFTFPIGTGLSKVTTIGTLPVKFNVQYWYYVAAPDSFGPRHQLRFQVVPIIPLPW